MSCDTEQLSDRISQCPTPPSFQPPPTCLWIGPDCRMLQYETQNPKHARVRPASRLRPSNDTGNKSLEISADATANFKYIFVRQSIVAEPGSPIGNRRDPQHFHPQVHRLDDLWNGAHADRVSSQPGKGTHFGFCLVARPQRPEIDAAMHSNTLGPGNRFRLADRVKRASLLQPNRPK